MAASLAQQSVQNSLNLETNRELRKAAEDFSSITFNDSIFLYTSSDGNITVVEQNPNIDEEMYAQSPGLLDKSFYAEKTDHFDNMSPIYANAQSPINRSVHSHRRTRMSQLKSPKTPNSNRRVNNWNKSRINQSVTSIQALSPNAARLNIKINIRPRDSEEESWQQRILASDTEDYLSTAMKHAENFCQKRIDIFDLSGFDLTLQIEEIQGLLNELTGDIFDTTKALELHLEFDAMKKMVKKILRLSPNKVCMDSLIYHLKSKLLKLSHCKKELEKINNILNDLKWLESLERQERKLPKPICSQNGDFNTISYSVEEMEAKLKEKLSEMHHLQHTDEVLGFARAKLSLLISKIIKDILDRYWKLSEAVKGHLLVITEERAKACELHRKPILS